MNPLQIVWIVTLLAALWFLPMGLVRVWAARRGATDYGSDMLNLGRAILAVGVVAALAFIGLSVWMVVQP